MEESLNIQHSIARSEAIDRLRDVLRPQFPYIDEAADIETIELATQILKIYFSTPSQLVSPARSPVDKLRCHGYD
jgi:hypothetical protein